MELRVITQATGAAPDQVASLTDSLREDLLAFGALRAEHPEASGPPPVGAKGLALEWAQLIVTLAGNLPALIAFVDRWAGDHRATSVRLELDGDVIELNGVTTAERHESLERFLARHPD